MCPLAPIIVLTSGSPDSGNSFAVANRKFIWILMIVTIEVILGYVMLGGLITIFASKLSRRGG